MHAAAVAFAFASAWRQVQAATTLFPCTLPGQCLAEHQSERLHKELLRSPLSGKLVMWMVAPGLLPACWPLSLHCASLQVAKLVRWLMAPNPADRPTAREVLRSEVLPPAVGDEQMVDLLRSLPDK